MMKRLLLPLLLVAAIHAQASAYWWMEMDMLIPFAPQLHVSYDTSVMEFYETWGAVHHETQIYHHWTIYDQQGQIMYDQVNIYSRSDLPPLAGSLADATPHTDNGWQYMITDPGFGRIEFTVGVAHQYTWLDGSEVVAVVYHSGTGQYFENEIHVHVQQDDWLNTQPFNFIDWHGVWGYAPGDPYWPF